MRWERRSAVRGVQRLMGCAGRKLCSTSRPSLFTNKPTYLPFPMFLKFLSIHLATLAVWLLATTPDLVADGNFRRLVDVLD